MQHRAGSGSRSRSSLNRSHSKSHWAEPELSLPNRSLCKREERVYGSAYNDCDRPPSVVVAGPRFVLHNWRLHSHPAGPRADCNLDPRAAGQTPSSIGPFTPRRSFLRHSTRNPVPVFRISSPLLAYFPVLNAKTGCSIVLSRRNEQSGSRRLISFPNMRCGSELLVF
jgi:hypothetical protein